MIIFIQFLKCSCLLIIYIGDLPYKAAWSTHHWRREAWKSKPCNYIHPWRGSTNDWHESGNELDIFSIVCLHKIPSFHLFRCYQDNYLYESYKMRNVLQEFVRHPRDQTPTILGLREHIFTGRSVVFLTWLSNI